MRQKNPLDEDNVVVETSQQWKVIIFILSYIYLYSFLIPVKQCEEISGYKRHKYVREKRIRKNIPSGSVSVAVGEICSLFERLGLLDILTKLAQIMKLSIFEMETVSVPEDEKGQNYSDVVKLDQMFSDIAQSQKSLVTRNTSSANKEIIHERYPTNSLKQVHNTIKNLRRERKKTLTLARQDNHLKIY